MGHRVNKLSLKILTYAIVAIFYFPFLFLFAKKYDDQTFLHYKNKVKQMFNHAYQGYMNHAYPLDELRPLTCDGQDTWGSYSLTLIDSLDTLVVMGNHTEFRRVVQILLQTLDFDKDLNVSVFETNIRVVGGLLSAHLLSKRAGMELEPGWPCSGPLLRLAEKVARKLLPAFDTPTGMPYGTINLLYGVPKGETPITCTAGVGTFIVEFGALSQLTGANIFVEKALKALQSLWSLKSPLGLVGNHVDVLTGKWTALDSSIGAGVDSYFEYLVKGSMLFGYPDLMKMFVEYKEAIEKHLKRDDWYFWAHMEKGSITNPLFQSLEAFWPGLLSLTGDIDSAMKSLHNYHQIWRQYGFIPEFYNIPKSEAHPSREGYPLRPELIESIMYLYKATKDPYLIDMTIDIVETIETSCRTSCGYATVKNVKDHTLDNRMESFFLAETLKYLYLIFDTDNFVHNDGSQHSVVMTPRGKCVIDTGGYIFNTEAHLIDSAILYCCSRQKQEDLEEIRRMTSFVDLSRLIDIDDDDDDDYDYKFDDYIAKKTKSEVEASQFRNSPDDAIAADGGGSDAADDGKLARGDDNSGIRNATGDNYRDSDVDSGDSIKEISRAESLANESSPASSHSSQHKPKSATVSTVNVCPARQLFYSDVCLISEYSDTANVQSASRENGLNNSDDDGRSAADNSTNGYRRAGLCPVDEDKKEYFGYLEQKSKDKDGSSVRYTAKKRIFSVSMYELMTCKARPFHARFSIMGQMFEDEE